MHEAKISEIFLSLQGEGIYLGEPQVFVRFYGCNLACGFCDTPQSSHKTFTKDALMSKILSFEEPYASVSLTGGEPLLQVDFLRGFLESYKRFYKKAIYLETNGTLYRELEKIIDFVDIIAMDIKLPSSTGEKPLWEEHGKFLKVAGKRKVFVKTVITSTTSAEDILKAKDIISGIDAGIPLVLQPVSELGKIKKPGESELTGFRQTVLGFLERVEIISQAHKQLGIK